MPATTGPAAPATPIPWAASLRLIGPLAAFKILTLLLVYCSLRLIPMPFNLESYRVNYHWPPDEPLTVRSAYETWDAQQFLFVSENGYVQKGSRGIFPLWPAVIHVADSVLGDPLAASLIAANLLSMAALILFHRLAALQAGIASADAALLLMLAFPSAFFLSLPYSESLFLLLVVGLFLALRAENGLGIWTLAALLPLARAVGVVCVCPIIVHECLKRRPLRAALLATGTMAGILVYFLIFRFMTGDAFANLHTTFSSTRASASNLVHPVQFVRVFFFQNIELHGISNSAVDRAVLILVLASLWPMARRDPVGAVYCFPGAIVPAMSLSMMSFTRYALVLFPVFIVGGGLLSPPRQKWWLYLVAATSLSLQILMLIRHAHWDWAA
jgi:hypothetical protein